MEVVIILMIIFTTGYFFFWKFYLSVRNYVSWELWDHSENETLNRFYELEKSVKTHNKWLLELSEKIRELEKGK